jgi:2-amino-4-hydroxy-6-hydroxymethyldihydropteridine diphosphokinase
VITELDWDAPARERLEAVLHRPTDRGWDVLQIARDVAASASGDAALFGRQARIEFLDREVDGAVVGAVDAGTSTVAIDYFVGLVRERLDSMSLGEFLVEYGIDPEQLVAHPVRAFLGIGSNLGDRLAFLQGAVDGLAATDGVAVVVVSPVYETEPVGPDQPDYLNAVVAVDTILDPRDLLAVGQRLEADAQRVRAQRFGPRTLDVDVVLYGDVELDEPDLVIPHPRWRERDFVLAPLADLGHPDVESRDWNGVRPTGLRLRVP